MYYQQVAANGRNSFFFSNKKKTFWFISAAKKITSASGQIVQRIRLHDEEERPVLNTILNDNNLLQYYRLLADRGDVQAQVK
jgi:hypothetical protein